MMFNIPNVSQQKEHQNDDDQRQKYVALFAFSNAFFKQIAAAEPTGGPVKKNQ